MWIVNLFMKSQLLIFFSFTHRDSLRINIVHALSTSKCWLFLAVLGSWFLHGLWALLLYPYHLWSRPLENLSAATSHSLHFFLITAYYTTGLCYISWDKALGYVVAVITAGSAVLFSRSNRFRSKSGGLP
jgi:hypothetical protein